MAEYIQPGQRITAQWLNSVVDQANGNVQPYTEGVIQTPNGPLMRNWQPNNAYDMPLYQLHQVRMGPAQTLFGPDEQAAGLSGVTQHMWIHLGRSFLGWSSSFQIDPYYIDRGMFAVQYEDETVEFYPINQNSFNLNDTATSANECTTSADVLNCEDAEQGTIHDYSGWVETPFNLNTKYGQTSWGSYDSLYCYLIDLYLPQLGQTDIKSTSQYVAAVYSNIDPAIFNLSFAVYTSEIENVLGARPHSIIYSVKICERSIDEKLAPGTNTYALPHLHQLMTGPIVARFQPMQELAPTFITRFTTSRAIVADASFPLTTPRIEAEKTDDVIDFYVGVDEWTVGGLPVYIKVHQLCLKDGANYHVYESNSAPTDPSYRYIQYEDIGYSTTYTGIIKIRNALYRTLDTTSQLGQRKVDGTVNGKLVCWAIPRWNAKINKWVVDLDFNESLDAPDLPSSPAEGQPFAEAWCLGWAGCSTAEFGTITHSKIIGCTQGSLTMPLADSQLSRRTSDYYEELDSKTNIYKSLGYEKTDMTERQSIVHDYGNISATYDYTPIELYKFKSSDYASQTDLSAALDDSTKKISFVCRVENDGISSDSGKDVQIEYFKAALGGGGSGKCLSAQGNLSSNVPVDCQEKLLKFDAGLSSNVEIDIAENNPGIVDVKIGVYYI